jgi:hypothetical protein
MKKLQLRKCSICNTKYIGQGNNPQPVLNNSNKRCCNACHWDVVVPRRLQDFTTMINKGNDDEQQTT